jgi:hypothetical protein
LRCVVKLLCPRTGCLGRARRTRIQEADEGRAWRGLVEVLYFEEENAIVRFVNGRCLPLSPAADAALTKRP